MYFSLVFRMLTSQHQSKGAGPSSYFLIMYTQQATASQAEIFTMSYGNAEGMLKFLKVILQTQPTVAADNKYSCSRGLPLSNGQIIIYSDVCDKSSFSLINALYKVE